MFVTLTDPYLRIALWGGIGTLTLISLIVLQILYLRLRLVLRLRSERAFLAQWRPILIAALSNPPATMPRLLRRDHVFFLKLWNHLHGSVRGESSAFLNQIANRLDCEAIAQTMLHKGNRAKRLLAILTLGELRQRTAWDALVAQAHSTDGAVSTNALHALVKIDAGAAATLLTPLLLQREDWQLSRIAGILQEAKNEFFATLLEAATYAKPNYLLRCLCLLEALRLSPPPATLAPLLDNQQASEIISAALRVTTSPLLLDQVRALATHADWTVRVQVAKVLGRIGEQRDVDCLRALLNDAQWWVRYRAAQALSSLPFFSRNQFEHMLEATSDRYARDMLMQVLAEGSR